MAVSRPVQAPQTAGRWPGFQRADVPQRVIEQRGAPQQGFAAQRVPEQRGVVEQRGGNQRGFAVRREFQRPNIIIARGDRWERSYRPYFTFRRHFSLGFGLFVGYPVAFPYWYDYPYGYGYGYDYGYGYGSGYGYANSYSAPVPVEGYPVGSSSVGVDPGAAAAYGGVSLDIQPTGAAVFVDGVYVGIVNDFSPTKAPLTIAVGDHHIELRAQGYQSMAFDVTVTSRQIVPYQGAMQVIRN